MSHYEKRLEADKEQIRAHVRHIGGAVADALEEALAALLAHDDARSYEIMLGDMPINRQVRALDAQCHAFVARHLPSAGHLRFISSVMRMNVGLERVGDYAVTISREAVQLSEKLPTELLTSVGERGAEIGAVLREAIKSFVTADEDLARGIRPQAKAFGRTFENVHRALLAAKDAVSARDLLALMTVFSKLDRVADQAKNIGEEALFSITGETKAPKVYRIHFVDARNTMFSPLAEAIARKAFPGSGAFSSSGWAAGDALAPEAADVATELGLDMSAFAPQKLARGVRSLEPFHVIVGLSSSTRQNIGQMPFATVYLEWAMPTLDSEADARSTLRQACQTLSSQIRDLMVTLRGQDAP